MRAHVPGLLSLRGLGSWGDQMDGYVQVGWALRSYARSLGSPSLRAVMFTAWFTASVPLLLAALFPPLQSTAPAHYMLQSIAPAHYMLQSIAPAHYMLQSIAQPAHCPSWREDMGLDENNPTTKLADKQMNCGSTPTHPRFLFYPITCTLSPGAHDQPGECCDAISLDTTGSARLIGSVRGEGFTNNAGIQTHTCMHKSAVL